MYSATKSEEFSFDSIVYQQIDGGAGRVLGPALANIFVGFYEHLAFENFSKPFLYFRYVNDTFAIFSNETECNQFLKKLNALHPFLVLKKKLIIHGHFLMFWLKNLRKSFLPQFIENPHLQDSTHAGIHLDQRKGKQILLALLFTKLLKFAALWKSFQEKSAKSKISCDRMFIQKKSLFLELKRFQTFKHPSDLT